MFRYGVGFAKVLLENVEGRFPQGGTNVKLRCVANYLDPAWKGVHLAHYNKLQSTKTFINGNWSQMRAVTTVNEAGKPPLSPTSKLLKEMGIGQLNANKGEEGQVGVDDYYKLAFLLEKRYKLVALNK